MWSRPWSISRAQARDRSRRAAPAQPDPGRRDAYKTALIYTYDCGDFGKNLEDCLIKADYAGFPPAAPRRAGAASCAARVSSTVEASNAGMIEHAEIRFDPTGTVTVSVGTHDHGQGHATTFRQIISDRLGIEPSRIRFNYGDTDQIAIGTGHVRLALHRLGRHRHGHRRGEDLAKGAASPRNLMEAGEHDIVFERASSSSPARQGDRPRHRRPRRLRAGQAAEGHRGRIVRERHLQTAASAPILMAVTSPKSRSTRRPAPSSWCAIQPSTMSGT